MDPWDIFTYYCRRSGRCLFADRGIIKHLMQTLCVVDMPYLYHWLIFLPIRTCDWYVKGTRKKEVMPSSCII